MLQLGRHVARWFDDLQRALNQVVNDEIGFIVRTSEATIASRTIEGTTGEIEVANGTGQTTNPVIGLPEVITSPRKFGTDTDNTEVEADGTVVFNGAATVYKDVFFPMAPPKTVGVGNPSLVSWNGSLRGYSFAIGDVHDFDPQEFPHDGKEVSTATWHIHFVSRSNVASIRRIAFQIEYSQASRNGLFAAPTTETIEYLIPANTPVNTHIAEDVATFTTVSIASQMFVRLTRIAATANDPATDPVIIGLHYHYKLDTVGSRTVFNK